jgi:UDP:flavonoid glycosyltransferase YjiC (YdhE family)
MWGGGAGKPPQWPPGNGAKIFAYLKPFPALPQLLDKLFVLLNPAIVYMPGVDDRVKHQFRCPNVQFADEPLEMNRVIRECDLAILNGTYAAIVMLRAGKPVLQLPIYLEQATNAVAIERLGAGICVPPNDPARVVKGLESLLSSNRYAEAARNFAARCADHKHDAQIERMISRAEELANMDSCAPAQGEPE